MVCTCILPVVALGGQTLPEGVKLAGIVPVGVLDSAAAGILHAGVVGGECA